MRVPGLQTAIADPRGPRRWLTAGTLRLAILCALIVAIEMLSPRVSSSTATRVVFISLGATVVGGLVAATLIRRAARVSGSGGLFGVVLHLLRHAGLPVVGLAFFLAWAIVYLALWAFRPTAVDGEPAAFTGLGNAPRLADFFYYSVSTGLISPPGDIVPTSRGARAATLVEMLTALALVGAYLAQFADVLGMNVRHEHPRHPDSRSQ